MFESLHLQNRIQQTLYHKIFISDTPIIIMKKLEAQIAGADDSGVKAVGILLREICRMSPQAAAGWNM